MIFSIMERKEGPVPVRTTLNRLYIVGMTCFRLMLCPGDDILAVITAATIGVVDGNVKEAIMPRDEIDNFITASLKPRAFRPGMKA